MRSFQPGRLRRHNPWGRTARRSQARGLLLAEAVFAASVIAGGLVYISRGLASQLKALRKLEQYSALGPLAESKLLELEAARSLGSPPSQEPSSGSVDAADGPTYQWTITARARADLDVDSQGRPLYGEVALSVQRLDEPGLDAEALHRDLFVVWPMEWIPANWLA